MRSAFLTPEFSPTDFLSSLHNRHQTLEDLRQELRARSQELNKELLDLVNENYQDFLGLGDSLKGGEEKVEEVRLGLLGFRREVDALKLKVEGRREDIEGLVQERREIAAKERVGRNLLDVDTKLGELEESLELRTDWQGPKKENLELNFSESEESEMDDASHTIALSRLSRRIQQYLYLRKLVKKIGPGHPFIVKQEGRFQKVRQTLLLDLSNALLQVKGSSGSEDRTLALLSLYRDIGESAEALKILKKPNQR